MNFEEKRSLWARIRTALNAFYPDCTLIRGRHKESGQRMTVLRCGGSEPIAGKYFIGQIFSEIDEERAAGRVPCWRVLKLAKQMQADFTLVHVHRALVQPFSALLKRSGGEVIDVPLFLEVVADISDEKRLLLASSHLDRDVRKVRNSDFSFERTTLSKDLRRFIRDFRDPYVSATHGLDSLNFVYEASLFAGDSFEGQGITLLKVLHKTEWVAGVVIVDSFHGRPVLWELGVMKSDQDWVRRGALAAAYWFSIQFLIARGYKSMSLSLVRPFINQGVILYKSKYRPTLTVFSSRRVLMIPNLASETAMEVLAAQPVIRERRGQLVPMSFRMSASAADPLAGKAAALARFRNLAPPEPVDWSHYAGGFTRGLTDGGLLQPPSPVSHFPRDRCLQHLFAESARQFGESTAVRYEEAMLTYAELQQSSRRLAAALGKAGIGRGAIVAVCAARSLHLPAWVLGVLQSGAAYLPLDPALPPERLHYMLVDAGVVAVVVDETTRALFETAPESCRVMIGHELIASPKSPIDSESPIQGEARDLAWIIYTSGSTGQPKGVAIEHRSVVNLLWDMKQRFGLREREMVLSIGSFAFDVTLPDWFWAFLSGGTVRIADETAVRDPSRLASLIAAHRPSHIQATPGTWDLLLRVGFSPYTPLRLVTTGEHIREPLRERLRKVSEEVWNLYGPTETTVWSSACHLGRDRSLDSIGQPIANTRFHIVGEDGSPVKDNAVGELWIGGEGVARGYLNRPELTAERFVMPSWAPGERLYRTGDLVQWNGDGGVRYLGRIDDQVKIRGYRIELGEIDAKLGEHPEIRASQTLCVEGHHSRRLVSFVVPQRTERTDSKAWKAFLGRELPAYMVPSLFLAIEGLPLTPNGKIDRPALLARLEKVSTVPAALVLSSLEQQVAGIWKDVLKIPTVAPQDTFWDLGGDSLLAVHMLLELKHRLDIEISFEALRQNPSLRDLCQHAEPGTVVDQPRLRPLRQGAPGVGPVIFTHGHNFCYSLDEVGPVIQYLDATRPVWGLSGNGAAGRRLDFQTLAAMAKEAVDLVEAHLPRHDLTLIGYCAGGLLAYELASQLTARGHRIERVIMIDTTTPAVRNAALIEDRVTRRITLLEGLQKQPLQTLAARLRSRWAYERQYFTKNLWRILAPLWVAMGKTLPLAARTPYYQAIQGKAFNTYVPAPLAAPVDLIKTNGEDLLVDYGWSDLCAGIHEHFIESPHDKILSRELSPKLAALISRIILNGDRRASPLHDLVTTSPGAGNPTRKLESR